MNMGRSSKKGFIKPGMGLPHAEFYRISIKFLQYIKYLSKNAV